MKLHSFDSGNQEFGEENHEDIDSAKSMTNKVISES